MMIKSRYVAMSYTAGTGKSAGINTQVDCQPMLLSDVYFLKSITYEKAGELSKAVSNLETYLKLRPHDAEAYYELANYLAKQKKFARAEQLCLTAQLFKSLKQYQKAIADYDSIIKNDNTLPEVFAGRAEAYRLLGNKQQALSDFKRTVQLDRSYKSTLVEFEKKLK
ncbi:tetratricopeptide repeat protein [bacterium]|nr:tetratricopeptide repeat protein [bacterium]MBP9811225.1 tetratricopeptide repeat protein [bacterium]